jgi:hypothetical protein
METIEDVRNETTALQTDLTRIRDDYSRVIAALERQRVLEKALSHYEAQQSATPPAPLISESRKKFDPIAPQVRALIAENVCHRGSMSWEEAMVTFKVSRSSIARIVKEEKDKANAEPSKPPQKKHGQKAHLQFPASLQYSLC